MSLLYLNSKNYHVVEDNHCRVKICCQSFWVALLNEFVKFFLLIKILRLTSLFATPKKWTIKIKCSLLYHNYGVVSMSSMVLPSVGDVESKLKNLKRFRSLATVWFGTCCDCWFSEKWSENVLMLELWKLHSILFRLW